MIFMLIYMILGECRVQNYPPRKIAGSIMTIRLARSAIMSIRVEEVCFDRNPDFRAVGLN